MNVFHIEKKIYRSKRTQFILLFVSILLITVGIILLFVLVILNPRETLFKKIYALLIIGIFLILLCAFLIFTLTNHLEVSSEGVVYYGDGFHMYTPWTNIVGITQIRYPFFPSHPTTVFVLRQPALLNISLEEGKRQRLPVVKNYWMMKLFTATPMNYLWYMPLHGSLVSAFDLEQGELSVYIRQYAPHLLEATTKV